MNMEQRAARHAEMHKQEGLLPHAGAHGEDVEAERPLFALAPGSVCITYATSRSKIWYNMHQRGGCLGITEKEVCGCRVITTEKSCYFATTAPPTMAHHSQ